MVNYNDPITKTINAFKFADNLKHEIKDFSEKLKSEDIDTSDIWKTYLAKLSDIIAKV